MRYNKMTNEILTIDEFLKIHKHIYYCEIIILPNGNVSYAVPSHIERMLKLLNFTITDAIEVIPEDETPIKWLMKETGSIPVWYDGVKVPPVVTKEQAISLSKLINANMIKIGIMADLFDTQEDIIKDMEKISNAIISVGGEV